MTDYNGSVSDALGSGSVSDCNGSVCDVVLLWLGDYSVSLCRYVLEPGRRMPPQEVASSHQTPEPKMAPFAPRLGHATELQNLHAVRIFESALQP